MSANTKVIFEVAAKRERSELTLPIQHFIAMDDWVNKLGHQAYIAWLKFYTYADRTESQRFESSLTKLCERLGVSKGTFYSKVIPPLWDYGFIDFKEREGFMTIVVYSYPQNRYELATRPLNKIRDYATEWESINRDRGKAGGKKSAKLRSDSCGSKIEPAGSAYNIGSKNEPKGGSKIEPNNNSKSFNNSNDLIDCLGDADKSIHASVYQALQKHAKKNCYVLDNTPIGSWYIDEIYTMLINQFPNQLDPEVVQLAAELYFDRACAVTMEGVIMKLELQNPVGYFRFCYEDAIKQWKAKRAKK
ncbi:hypothetical protein J2TS6_42840 [Paenibacillus albilobatus]|uniref:Uncharacterized protein n=1 Tax=Paenibacillus albilobatus TaxID=2716884 RepID=A0A919XKN3_9BACL|nr:hypothetical protein [Paenibacillus albilobatus]GIO33143.1 hypothetical protein J2TS6_42840 [Paenibacillus albilobatus]